MSNHNKIRPVDKKDLKGKYKILFSTPQSKNSKIPLEFRGLQIFKNKKDAELALKKRIDLTELLREKNRKLMEGNQRAMGNSGGNKLNLFVFLFWFEWKDFTESWEEIITVRFKNIKR